MILNRNILLILLITTVFTSCKNSSNQSETNKAANDISSSISIPMDENKAIDTTDVAKVQFQATEVSFDTISHGDRITKIFNFTNIGKRPLLIYDVRTSCGCTAVDYPKDFIRPGESGKLEVTFDSTGRKGYQNKSINVIGNTFPTRTLLYLHGFVKS
ncbi:DUF1573 domain-containing protein [Membranihabitans maritimus]|uniref:DUF1573 domain-containing protein n=1 Tax=Membranihabitans maritimus TaxID=2904244 RepID=UPI001F2FED82|nr:DUF1573 domain-containing protein [Membranihabitans maritimus]